MNEIQRQRTATSRDGIASAFEQAGTRPVVILVPPALADRSATRPDHRGRDQESEQGP